MRKDKPVFTCIRQRINSNTIDTRVIKNIGSTCIIMIFTLYITSVINRFLFKFLGTVNSYVYMLIVEIKNLNTIFWVLQKDYWVWLHLTKMYLLAFKSKLKVTTRILFSTVHFYVKIATLFRNVFKNLTYPHASFAFLPFSLNKNSYMYFLKKKTTKKPLIYFQHIFPYDYFGFLCKSPILPYFDPTYLIKTGSNPLYFPL